MNFSEYTRFYLIAFYLLGLSPYHSKGNDEIFCYLSKLFHLFVSFSISLLILHFLNENGVPPAFTPGEAVIFNFSAICEMFRSMAILVQCVLFKNCMNETMRIFQNMGFYFEKYLRHRICYRSLSKATRLKFGILLGVVTLYVCSFTIRFFYQDEASKIGLLFKVIQVASALTSAFITFYIDLLNFYVTQLNSVIRRDTIDIASLPTDEPNSPSKCGHNKFSLNQLKHYKIIHFHLWLASQRINKYFGYSLIIMLFQVIFSLVYWGWWIFRKIHFLTDYKSSIWSMLISLNFLETQISIDLR